MIPVYQSEKTLGQTISSVLTQSYQNIEIVICIDGATDRSAQIADSFGDLVTVVRQENQGLSAARNTAIRHSRGELIAILDADDQMLPSYVERAVARWRDLGGGRRFISSNAHMMSRHGLIGKVFTRPQDDLSRQRMLMLERNIATIFSVFPRAMWEELGGFDTELRALEDHDMWVRAVLSGWTLHFVTEATAVYRLTPGSLSSKGELMNESNTRMRTRILERYGDSLSPEEREFLTFTATHDWARYSKDKAAIALAQGDVSEAARLCSEAARLSPSDRGIRLKAELMTHLPMTSRVYRWRERVRLERTAR